MPPPFALRRHADPRFDCACLDPAVPLGACGCNGRTHELLAARYRVIPPEACLRCDRGERAVSQHGLCARCLDELAALARRAPERPPPSGERRCAWCGLVEDDLLGRDGIFLCDTCAKCGADDSWRREGRRRGSRAPATAPCSFCGLPPPATGAVGRPDLSVCDRCVERALKLRRRRERAPRPSRAAACAFDGRALSPEQEFFVSERGDAFCDECLGLLEALLRHRSVALGLGLAAARAGDGCGWCGTLDGERLATADGPALCVACIREAPRVGRWCERCQRPAWRAGALLDVGWCPDCVRREARVAALLRTSRW